jgi:hypothetical protein
MPIVGHNLFDIFQDTLRPISINVMQKAIHQDKVKLFTLGRSINRRVSNLKASSEPSACIVDIAGVNINSQVARFLEEGTVCAWTAPDI